MVRSAQTAHLSCVKVSTISKRTESSFQLSLVTMEYHWVRSKRFLSQWYVRRNPCTYLALTLIVSKWTKTRFHMTEVTKELHRVRPK
jgi:hypothetical protein